jgi:predicted Zn-dependent protease
MADYLILKKDPTRTGPEAWQVLALSRNKTADAAGAQQALAESYTGDGKYGVLRADNARTVTVTHGAPTLTEDTTPEF